MIIYIPVFFICIGLKCQFLQATTYTLSEKACMQEIQTKKSEFMGKEVKIEAFCLDMEIKNETI
jgi:hypothetical protein